MKSNTIRIKALLSTMILSEGTSEYLKQTFYNEILSELDLIHFIPPDKYKEYDKLYKNFIKATIKNYLYEQSEENKNSIKDLIVFLQSFKVIGEDN